MANEDETWEQRYKELQGYMTKMQERYKWAEGIAEMYSANPQYQEAIKAVDEGRFGRASTSTPPQFSSPNGSEPEYVRNLRAEIATLKGDIGETKAWREEQKSGAIRAGIEELERMEADYRKKKPHLPDEFWGGKGRINGLMAKHDMDFEKAAEFAEYSWQRERDSQPKRTSFGPIGGAPPPTGTGKEPENAEEASQAALATFQANVAQLGG